MTWIADRIAELTACLETELASDPPCEIVWWPGNEVSWEFCDDCGGARCGMAYIVVSNVFHYQTFPFPDTESEGRADSPLGYDLRVGVLRCLGGAEDDGNIEAEAYDAAALRQHNDALAVRRAVRCCSDDISVRIGQYTPEGPDGNCVGGFWSVTIGL